jgi:hypothetical protein
VTAHHSDRPRNPTVPALLSFFLRVSADKHAISQPSSAVCWWLYSLLLDRTAGLATLRAALTAVHSQTYITD